MTDVNVGVVNAALMTTAAAAWDAGMKSVAGPAFEWANTVTTARRVAR